MKTRNSADSYCWLVIQDPTRRDDDPGLFYKNLFRWTDIRIPREELERCWPDGIVFKNMQTGKLVCYEQGSLVEK